MKNIKGLTLYKGASKVDGSPIVVIATLSSKNVKTGNMIQTWIIREDMHPSEAVNLGADKSVCGSCPHRHHTGGACYVIPAQALGHIYRAYKNGLYPMYDKEQHGKLFYKRNVRLGAYGDPAAVPFELWEEIVGLSGGHTGYTHHYGAKHFDPRLTDLCMVSVETPAQVRKAAASGIRTFRAKPVGSNTIDGEMTCLADSEGLSCEQCMACSGGSGISVVVDVHGQRKKRFLDKFEDVIIKQAV